MKPTRLLSLLPILFTGTALACSYFVPNMSDYAKEKQLVIYGQFDSAQNDTFVLQRSINRAIPTGRYQIKQEQTPTCPSLEPPPSTETPVEYELTTEHHRPNITAPANASFGDHYYVFVIGNAENGFQQLWGDNTLLRVHRQQIITLTPPTPDSQSQYHPYREGDQFLQSGYWTTSQQSFEKWLMGKGREPKWQFIKKPTQSY